MKSSKNNKNLKDKKKKLFLVLEMLKICTLS